MSILNQLYFSTSKRNNLVFDLPVAQRLTLGFLATALIAAVVMGSIGILRAQSLHKLSDFYQNLLQTKTTLVIGANLLDLMNSELHATLDLAATPNDSQESLRNDQSALQKLTVRYDNILKEYVRQDLLEQHPDQVSLLKESNHASQVAQQKLLVGSALRTWYYCRNAQIKVLQDLANHDLFAAQSLTHLLAEPTIADAQSALRALTQFDNSLANSVLDSVRVEEQLQLLTTIIGIVFTCIGIALIGQLISGTLVYRLKQLRRVTQAIEDGKLSERVSVIGRDELADIASSVNAMLEIIAAEKEARTAGELRDQFIASVSHELRNPLTEVYGWLELLRDYQGQLDASTQTKFLDNAFQGSQELMLLIDNVLDSTHIGKIKSPQLEAMPVAQVVHSVLEHLDPREAQKHSFHMDTPTALVAWADQQYLRQILRNLLSNALKYSPPQAAISIRVTRLKDIAATETDTPMHVCICVQDAGPGIPPSEIPHLFQKFKRLQRDITGTVRGTGLGLYISKQLVEAMKGRIWVESSGVAGEGSRFYFTLPEASSVSPSSDGDSFPVSATAIKSIDV